jgi:phosphate transport system protein
MLQTRSTLDRELQGVQDNVLRMGSLVESSITRALEALARRDTDLANHVIADDVQINQLRFETEEECLKVIATQQPAARDLRTIMAAMNIVIDLERMGDHAAGIAKIVLRTAHEPLLKPLIDMPRMAHICQEMIRGVLDAYMQHDPTLARAVASRDDQVDQLYNQIFRELLTFMLEDPRTTTRALYLLWSAHNLERIGDRVTNIAERVVFMTSGELEELND